PLLGACGSGDAADAGQLTLGTTEIMQFDPYLTNASVHIHTFYSYLIGYDEEYTPVPAGAEDWAFAEDHLSVTITLGENTFHSGDPVTADDVVVGVERALDPEAGFTLAQPSSFIDSATAEDERTVRIDFVEPTPDELVLDWMFAFPLVPADKNTPEALEHEPAGSGPFLLEDFKRDQKLTLVKNPEFWDEGKPHLDKVEFRFFSDEESLVASLESGDVDGATYLALRHAERLRERFTLVEGKGRMDLFFMNGAKAPFDNKELRQAIARAVDRDRVVEQVRFDMAEPVYTAFMPESPAFDDAYLTSHAFDLEAAEKLLKSSGGATSAVAGVGDEPGAMEILQIIQADLEKIGFALEIEPMEQTTFLDELFAGNLECCVAAQPNNLQSPSLIARGRQMLPSKDNVMMSDNVPEDYVKAVDETRTAIGDEDKSAAYARINEILVDEAWAVGIATRQSLTALEAGISGFVVGRRDDFILTDVKRE
ncbi:MAG: ABC transporter substrate-binding protein, partial [Stackebrandtia sp.]